MKKSMVFLWVVAVCTLLVFSGCSDSDSDDIATISGTASSGAPVVGTITLKDADGTELGPIAIESNGNFSFNVTGYTAPFVLKATATASEESLYSYALGSGQANVNPLTTLIVASAAGVDDPLDVYEDHPTGISENTLSAAVLAVQTVLANLYTAFGVDADFDPLIGDCTVNHVGIDALFDAVTITIGAGGVVNVKAVDDTVLFIATLTTLDEAEPVTQGAADDAASQVSLNGTYNYCELYLDTPSGGNGATAAAGHITFDPDGTWAAVVGASSSSGDIGETNSGTYSIDSSGRIWVNGSEYGVVTPDGEVMIIPDLDASEGEDVGLTILCKRPGPAIGDEVLDGTYVGVDLYRNTPAAGSGTSAGVNTITFNGDGTYGVAGTYNVDSNGRFTVDGEDYGMVAMNGDVIVLPDYDSTEGTDLGISIMVRTSTAAGWGEASIDADYNFAEMFADIAVTADSSENAVNSAGGVLSFDGAGVYAGTIAYSSAGDTDDFRGTYTAPTGVDNETLNCMLADGEFGIFSPNGYLLVVPDDDTAEGEDVGLTLGVQAW